MKIRSNTAGPSASPADATINSIHRTNPRRQQRRRQAGRLAAALVGVLALFWLSTPQALAQTPDLTVAKSDSTDGSASLGREFRWQIVVRNQSGADAVFAAGTDLLLDDLVPATYGPPEVTATAAANALAVDCSVGAGALGQRLTCIVAGKPVTITGGGSITVTLPVTPATIGVHANPVAAGRCVVDPNGLLPETDEDNNDCGHAVTVGAPDLIVTKSNNVAGSVSLGSSFTWTVTLENRGNRTAHFPPQVWMLEDELPTGARYSQPTISEMTGVSGSVGCVIYNKIVACQAQDDVAIAVGGRVTAQFVVTPTTLGTLTNGTAACRGDPQNTVAESDENNNGCLDSVLVTGIDLRLTKSADREQVAPGESILYTLAYGNGGNRAASGVAITETVPAGSTFNAALSSAGWDCPDGSAAGSSCHFPVGTLAVDGSGSVQFGVSTPSTFETPISSIENQADIGDDGANGADVSSADNRARLSTPVSGAPVMAAIQSAGLISDNDGDRVPSPGDKIRYSVTITNSGSVPATAVLFSATPDVNAPLAVGTVRSSQGTILAGNAVGQSDVRIELGTLPPSQPVTLRFDVIIADPLAAGVTVIENQSQISGANVTPLLTDDPATPATGDPTVTPVNALPVLSATLADALLADLDANGRPSPGDRLRYTVTIRNRGNGTASTLRYDDTGSSHTDLIPGSVTVVDNRGTVVSGNGAGEKNVRVAMDQLPGGGAELILRYDVTVVSPLPAGVTQVQRQGVVTGAELPPTLTTDPDGSGGNAPTVTALDVSPRLRATKQDRLLVDRDNSGSPSPGDTLLYAIRIRNEGNAGAVDVRFEDSLDDYLMLDPGGVRTTVGRIVSGIDADDRALIVDIGDLPAGSAVEIALTATISDRIPTGPAVVVNQGIVKSATQADILTDDPDQPGTGDPTTTLIASDVVIYGALQDYLLVDGDGSGTLTRGDTLLYRLDIYNYGDLPARNGSVEIDNHPSLLLQGGSVKTNLGSVLAGNNQQDTEAVIEIDQLAPGAQATITLEMVVNVVDGLLAVEQQAVIWFDNPRGDLFTVFSDDPATPAIGDSTVSALYGIREVAELFLPIVLR